MSRVLLLMTTTTYKARAFLDAAERLGAAAVVGTDHLPTLAAANPAGSLTLRFRDLEGATAKIVEFSKTHPLDAIVAADDEGVELAALASSELGLAYSPLAAVRAARSKRLTRERLAAAGLPTPEFMACSVDHDPEVLSSRVAYPCVLKPTSLSASRGVIRADARESFVGAFARLRRILLGSTGASDFQAPERAGILIESFIPGAEVAVEGLLAAGRLRLLAIFDKPDPLDGPFFEESIYVTPSRHPAPMRAAIEAETARAVEALGLREGPVHAELRLNEHGAWILEVAPRSIGGLCSRALLFVDGAATLSLEELILRQALGRDTHTIEREAQASGVMMIPVPQAGILRGVGGQDAARAVAGIEDVRITTALGDEVLPAPEGFRYLGFLFARGETPADVEAALRAAHAALRIDVEPYAAAGDGTPRTLVARRPR